MNFSMKTTLAAIAMMTAASTASAGCMSEEPCLGSGYVSQIGLGGTAEFVGAFNSVATGNTVYQGGEKKGFSDFNIGLTGSGDGCTADCSIFGWTVDASAGEHVESFAGALSETSGEVASAQNNGISGAMINFQVLRLQGVPVQQ